MRKGIGIALASIGLLAISRAVTRYIWPVEGGVVRSTFGNRTDPIEGTQRFHNGIDIGGVPAGRPVRAVEDGIVGFAGPSGTGGNTVVLYLDDSNRAGYAHLARIDVAQGDVVRRGDIIGTVGATGRVTGPHLHFTLSRNDTFFDPLPYF